MDSSPYYEAIREAEDDLAEALGCIRAEEDEGNITPAAAAAERVGLLERHVKRCKELRREHFPSPRPGGEPPDITA